MWCITWTLNIQIYTNNIMRYNTSMILYIINNLMSNNFNCIKSTVCVNIYTPNVKKKIHFNIIQHDVVIWFANMATFKYIYNEARV